jgi:hypothetical protein
MSMQYMMNGDNFVHPLHKVEGLNEPKLSIILEDDVSVLSGESEPSKWSTSAANNSHVKSSFKRSSLSSTRNLSKRNSVRHSSRRFLDLTINGGRDFSDEDEELKKSSVDENETDDDSDDNFPTIVHETSTIFAIPVLSIAKEKESGRSEARRFIDLTCDEEDDIPPPMEVTSTSSKRFLLGWIGRQDTSRTMDIQNSSSTLHMDAQNIGPCSSPSQLLITNVEKTTDHDCDTSVNSDYEDDAMILTPWEAADVAFIEGVHEIARNLERSMNDQGLESPFWAAEEVFPLFQDVHSKLKDNMNKRVTKYSYPILSTRGDDTAKSSIGSKVSRLTCRLSDDLTRKHVLQDSMGGYDDLGMRALHRDDRAYLKTFLYELRRDGSCSLPMVLARGLEKQLCNTAIHFALGVINDLTSPLRSRRQNPMTIQDGEYHHDDGD